MLKRQHEFQLLTLYDIVNITVVLNCLCLNVCINVMSHNLPYSHIVALCHVQLWATPFLFFHSDDKLVTKRKQIMHNIHRFIVD